MSGQMSGQLSGRYPGLSGRYPGGSGRYPGMSGRYPGCPGIVRAPCPGCSSGHYPGIPYPGTREARPRGFLQKLAAEDYYNGIPFTGDAAPIIRAAALDDSIDVEELPEVPPVTPAKKSTKKLASSPAKKRRRDDSSDGIDLDD